MILQTSIALLVPTICWSAELRLLQAVWRHGDRAPGDLPYPNDRYDEKAWPRGWDQLTNKGIWQAAELGTWLYTNYGKSVLKVFNKDKIYIRASDSERAIETAQGVAAGLFPPTGDRIWESSFLKYWQPTPIHTGGDALDPLLRPTKIDCPLLDRLVDESLANLAPSYNQKYSVMFKYLQEKTGLENVSFPKVKSLYDIQREIDHNMPQEKWLNQVFNGEMIMDHIREIKRVTRNEDFNSPAKAKLSGGFLLNRIIENMENAVNNASTMEAFLYSAHDGTVSALMNALGVADGQLVPYAATLLLELYDDQSVKIIWRNNTETTYTLHVPGCSENCSFAEFATILEPMRVRSFEDLIEVLYMISNFFFIYQFSTAMQR
ncbi:unnamed protein product [Caenorhabditis bovis]|uniref:Uncharacterized protein n=1 Tax=Caenorhabditis bovis TaxID=2654633 RepID=A0A8S1EB16_9PELO|nr:unnamed protein product [Caenorhabditis bovis]